MTEGEDDLRERLRRELADEADERESVRLLRALYEQIHEFQQAHARNALSVDNIEKFLRELTNTLESLADAMKDEGRDQRVLLTALGGSIEALRKAVEEDRKDERKRTWTFVRYVFILLAGVLAAIGLFRSGVFF